LAGVYNAQARFDDAQEAAQQALSKGTDSWDVQYEIARALIGKRQYETALTITEATLLSTPHGSLMHLAKAHALLGLGRYPQAVTELRAYLRYQPDGEGSERARDLLNQIQGAE
jgi:tetratricopeptide (TPR) repeat protein